jgi:hypothetical protein
MEGSRAFGASYVYANLLGNESGRAIFDGEAMIASGGQLLAAPAEDEGIPALQPNDLEPLKGQADDQAIDVVLRQGVAALALGDIDQLRRGRRQGEDPVGDQAVMDHHLGGGDDPRGLDGQQVRIARTCAHQPDPARPGRA